MVLVDTSVWIDLIAQTAIDHGVVLLHDDRDFDRMAAVEPRLHLMRS
jgi:predicted nucleic acid-binding protein